MNSWTSVASSLSFANWFSDDESLRVGGRAGRYESEARGAAGGRRGRKVKSLLDSPNSSSPPSPPLLLRLDATLPPIVVRSPGGKELDTDTSYQRSLRHARAKCLLGLPLSSSEWQLPHAPAPSRPDYSRVVPPPPVAKIRRSPRPAAATAAATAAAAAQLAIAGNSGYLESGSVSPRPSKAPLAPLPPIRPAAALATFGSCEVVYASFVACSVLHQRYSGIVQHDDVRAVLTDYQFPGWCYGCRMLHERPPADAAADGASYNPLRDRPVRVGGGYAYVVRQSDSDADDRRDAAAPAPRQLPISLPGPEGGAATMKRSQSAFDLRVIDRLPRIIESVRGQQMHLLTRRGAWLSNKQLGMDKPPDAPGREHESWKSLASQPSATEAAASIQATAIDLSDTYSEKAGRPPMHEEHRQRGENQSPSAAAGDDDVGRIAQRHSASWDFAPQMLTTVDNGATENAPSNKMRNYHRSVREQSRKYSPDENNNDFQRMHYSNPNEKRANARTTADNKERLNSSLLLEQQFLSLRRTTPEVHHESVGRENAGENVAKSMEYDSVKESENHLYPHTAESNEQGAGFPVDSMLEHDETLTLAGSLSASKEKALGSNILAESKSDEGSSSSNGGGSTGSRVRSSNGESQRSSSSQLSRSLSHEINGNATPLAAVKLNQKDASIFKTNSSTEKQVASPSKEATEDLNTNVTAGKDMHSSTNEVAAADAATDAGVATADEAAPAADMVLQSTESAAGNSTSQRNLEELLHSAVQVSSWKQDTAILTAAVQQHFQEAQVLLPSVITIPTNQASVDTQSVVTGLLADKMLSQSADVIEMRDIQDESTAVTSEVENADHGNAEPISESLLASPQKDALRSKRTGSKSFLKPLQPPAGARRRGLVAADSAAPEELSNGTSAKMITEDGVQQTLSHPTMAKTPNKVNATDVAKDDSRTPQKKPEMKTVARKKDKAILTTRAKNDNAATQESHTDILAEQRNPLKTLNDENVSKNAEQAGGTTAQRTSDKKTTPRSTEPMRSQTSNEMPVATSKAESTSDQPDASSTVTVKKRSAARKIEPPVPAEKPNFMHLLSIGTAPEDQPPDVTPISQTPSSPEMEFVIQREPTTPEPQDTPLVLPQPAAASSDRENGQTVEPPRPPPAVKKELPPPPAKVDVGPPPQVVKKRLKALKLFESRSRVVSLVQRRSEISSPTRRELLRAGADPVDYLTKYCLIHSDRLPYYERVFREVVTHQQPRLKSATKLPTVSGADTATDGSETQQKKVNEPAEHQKRLMRLAAQLPAHVPSFREPAINAAECQAARVQYTMERLQARYEKLVIAIEQLEQERNQALASAARLAYPEILAPDYKPSSGNRKRSPKRKKRSPSPGKTPRASTLPDSQVLERLSASQRDNLTDGDKTVRGMTLRLERMEAQCATAEIRAAELLAEKEEMKNWAQELFSQQQSNEKLTAEYRLSQTQFFNRLHPLEDLEMNLEELEYALQLINNHLITDKERKYIYHVLDIPGNTRINLKLFSCIAALSEKVHQLDPIIRKLINKLDYEALEIKMEACKEMFFLIANRSADNGHHIQLSDLGVELAAGGLSADTVRYVIGRLDFMSTGQVEYLDFLMYIPLFLEIHQKIVKEPLGDRSPRRLSSVGK